MPVGEGSKSREGGHGCRGGGHLRRRDRFFFILGLRAAGRGHTRRETYGRRRRRRHRRRLPLPLFFSPQD